MRNRQCVGFRMRLACVSPADQGICAGLSRWGTVLFCVSGSNEQHICACDSIWVPGPRTRSTTVRARASKMDDFSALLIECKKGNARLAEKLCDKGVDINKADAGGGTPLLMACCFGRKKVVEMLCSKGAAVNQAADGCMSPLTCRAGRVTRRSRSCYAAWVKISTVHVRTSECAKN
eukprot:1521225-Prymnesium_polylepis.2